MQNGILFCGDFIFPFFFSVSEMTVPPHTPLVKSDDFFALIRHSALSNSGQRAQTSCAASNRWLLSSSVSPGSLKGSNRETLPAQGGLFSTRLSLPDTRRK